MITPFWRDNPLSEDEEELVEALFDGHREATKRQNVSSEVLKAAYLGSGDFNKSVVAAISTLGGLHAPIIQAYEVLQGGLPTDLTSAGKKVPGWGNSFIKARPDSMWDGTAVVIDATWPNWSWKINSITAWMHDIGKPVFPNAACYTAAVAHIIGLPKDLSPMLVIRARLEPWAELLYDQQRQPPTENLRDNGT